MDEAVKLARALDAVIRHKLKVIGVVTPARAGRLAPPDGQRALATVRCARLAGTPTFI
jgi:hypothetical protein